MRKLKIILNTDNNNNLTKANIHAHQTKRVCKTVRWTDGWADRHN